MVKNLPSNVGDTGLISGRELGSHLAQGLCPQLLSLPAATREKSLSHSWREAHLSQRGAHEPQDWK